MKQNKQWTSIIAVGVFLFLLFQPYHFSEFIFTFSKTTANEIQNAGCQKCCDPRKMVNPTEKKSAWFTAIDYAFYHRGRTSNKPLRTMNLEELRNEFDAWYYQYGWEYHLRNYGWAGTTGTSEYYHYDPWDQYCWEYTIRQYHMPVGKYDTRRAVACDTVRVEIANLQIIHCLINCKVRELHPNAR